MHLSSETSADDGNTSSDATDAVPNDAARVITIATLDAQQLSELILATADTPTPQRITESITSLATSEVLREGQRLPTVRAMAASLRVSPATVSTAYHALSRAGVLASRGRAGTYVLPQAHTQEQGRALPLPVSRQDMPLIDLSKGTPDPALLPDIRPFLSKLGNRKAFVNSYDGPTILPMLEGVLRRNWPYEPQAMTMVSGAGDGLSRIIESTLRPGDFVITETPTYPPVLGMIDRCGATALGVPMDDCGMLPEALDRALRLCERPSAGAAVFAAAHRPNVAMIVVQPRAQNPTGASMTEQRIDELADVLLRHYDDERNMPLIVEDDHSGDVANAYAVSFAQRLPDHVVHIRSFSKSHGPDLRLAALSGTDEIVGLLNARRRLGPGWVSRFLQEILSEMLTDKRTFSTVISARHTYATRQRTMNALLRRQGLDVHTGDGLNMWVPVRDDAAAAQLLAESNIRVAAGQPFRPRFCVAPSPGFSSGSSSSSSSSSEGPSSEKPNPKTLSPETLAECTSPGIRITIAQSAATSERVAALLAQAARARDGKAKNDAETETAPKVASNELSA
ncbi:MAG: aminotransferase class I/II-fold pyridoxal phosphate-dependent enzyme [Bifidobacterium tibiigranuli]|jgi:DNA-binding transcriptional MocR family regulator|nr:aminotransferase class I/II-fold pyridoxal phosphate-dependent enzyme [Bifidobacterium tibiigranuli]